MNDHNIGAIAIYNRIESLVCKGVKSILLIFCIMIVGQFIVICMLIKNNNNKSYVNLIDRTSHSEADNSPAGKNKVKYYKKKTCDPIKKIEQFDNQKINQNCNCPNCNIIKPYL